MIIDVLERYASTLRQLGSPVQAPGHVDTPAANDLRALLRQHGLESLDDVVGFFVWFTGASTGHRMFSHDLTVTPLSQALEIRRELVAVAREVATDEPAASPEDTFVSTWLPLGHSDPQLVVETASGPTQGFVMALWWDDPPTIVATSIEEFVETRRVQLLEGEVVIEGQSVIQPVVRSVLQEVAVLPVRAGREVLIPTVMDDVDRAIAAATAEPGRDLVVRHSGVGDIPANNGLELQQRDLVVDALVAGGVDRTRIATEEVPLGEDKKPTHHLIGIYLRNE